MSHCTFNQLHLKHHTIIFTYIIHHIIQWWSWNHDNEINHQVKSIKIKVHQQQRTLEKLFSEHILIERPEENTKSCFMAFALKSHFSTNIEIFTNTLLVLSWFLRQSSYAQHSCQSFIPNITLWIHHGKKPKKINKKKHSWSWGLCRDSELYKAHACAMMWLFRHHKYETLD